MNETHSRALRIAWITIPLVSALILVSRWPVFTDEIAWKWLTSRWWFDGRVAVTLYPQCSQSFSIAHPLLFWPFRIWDSIVYGSSEAFFRMRYLGILSCAIWLLVFVRIVKGLSPQGLMAGLGTMLFGVLPFVLVMNRPEQSLVFSLMVFVWLPLIQPGSKKQKMAIFLSFVAVTALFFSQHAKALFFLPIVLISCSHLKISKSMTRIALIFPLVFAGQCYFFFSEHTRCTNDFVKSAFARMMISPDRLLESPREVIWKMVGNGIHASEYIRNILVMDNYPTQWLPTNYGFHFGARALNLAIEGFFVLWIAATLFGMFARWRAREKQRAFSYPLQMAFGIVVSFLGLAFFQTGKGFYDSGLIIPLIVLLGVLTIEPRFLRACGLMALSIGMASIVLISYRFWPTVSEEWRGGQPLNQQFHSVKPQYQRMIKDRVMTLAERCRLKNESQVQHLVLDDLTYPYFMKSREPFHAVYVMGWWGKMSIEDPEKFFRDRGVSGVISQCHWLPESLLKRADRDRDLCCLPAF